MEKILARIDEANARDPRMQTVEGRAYPRELIFSRRVFEWINRLDPSASDAVRLAARSHTLQRWEVPRTDYGPDTASYHLWRGATANHSAKAATQILKQTDCSDETISKVSQLIKRELLPPDPEAQLLEDADCLAFLDIKLGEYLEQWEGVKLRRILQGTWRKMSAPARQMAMDLPLDPRVKKIIQELTS